MDDYRRELEDARRDRNGEPVLFNRSQDHAAAVIENLFRAANSNIRILANTLEPTVYGEARVIEAAKAFLRRPETHVEILTETYVAPNHSLVRALLEIDKDRVFLMRVPDQVQTRYPYNFCVADEDCYRFEADRGTCEASLQFGNATTAGKMVAIFAYLKGESLKAHSAAATDA